MNLVDSSGWLEHFADGPNASYFEGALAATEQLLVPAIVLYEVHKKLLQQVDVQAALRAAAAMHEGRVVALDSKLALAAARIAAASRLPMADSIILATAQAFDALLWTQDADFEGLPGVRYCPK